HEPAVIALAGAELLASLNGQAVPLYVPLEVPAGSLLSFEARQHSGQRKRESFGARAYLCVRHGFDIPSYLGSCSTFTLGGFGGHSGRALRCGDVLRVRRSGAETPAQAL